MISLQEATQIASEYFDQFYSDEPFRDARLEEVERSEEEGNLYWLITLGYTDESESTKGPLSSIYGKRRRYKIFKIDAESGDVQWMKIRSPENA